MYFFKIFSVIIILSIKFMSTQCFVHRHIILDIFELNGLSDDGPDANLTIQK